MDSLKPWDEHRVRKKKYWVHSQIYEMQQTGKKVVTRTHGQKLVTGMQGSISPMYVHEA